MTKFQALNPKLLIIFLAALLYPHWLLAAPYAYPVPFVEGRDDFIRFTGLPVTGTIKVYTVEGEEVACLDILPADSGLKRWDRLNSSGNTTAAGVYIYEIESSGQKTTGKLIIVR